MLNDDQYKHVLHVANMMSDIQFVMFTSSNIETKLSNVRIMCIDTDHFSWCLHQCEIVWTTGGFMLPSEAVALGRLILITPTINHYEQSLNTKYFARTFPKLVKTCSFNTCEKEIIYEMIKRFD